MAAARQPEIEDVALDRVRELKQRRDEAVRTLASMGRAAAVPPHLYKASTIAAFQAKLKRALLSADQGLARRYLKRLLSRVVVTTDEIVIEARPDTALEMLAAGGTVPDEATQSIFLTHVAAWRPSTDTSTNFRVRFRIEPRRRSRPKAVPTEPPRIVRVMQLADEWQRMLDTGEVRNRAELARRTGVSGMWVTNVLRLLNLHPDIQSWVRGLPPGTPERFVTERALRSVARLPPERQIGGSSPSDLRAAAEKRQTAPVPITFSAAPTHDR